MKFETNLDSSKIMISSSSGDGTRKRERCMRATIIPSVVSLTTTTTTTNEKKLSTSMMSEQFYPSSSSSISKSISDSSSMQEEQKNDDNLNDDNEYDRAVAFLRDFHSKRVARYSPLMHSPLHSSSLDSILENDDADEQQQQQHQQQKKQLEDLLSSDFALALNVGSSSGPSSQSSSSSVLPSLSPYPTRIKKVATSKCLLGLVDDMKSQCPSLASSTSDSELSSSSTSSIGSCTSSSSSFPFPSISCRVSDYMIYNSAKNNESRL